MTVPSRPVPGASRPYRFPVFERARLPNGLAVLVAPVRRLPLVSVRVVLDAAAREEARSHAGVAALAAGALAEGTTRLDANALADAFERLGSTLATYAGWDATQARVTVLSHRLDAALRLLGDVVRTPAFSPREVDRLRSERLAELLELKAEPRGLADERFSTSLYRASSRYGIQEGGDESTVGSLTAESCREWHHARFAPHAVALVVAGDVRVADVLRLAEDVFGDWQATAAAAATADDSPADTERRITIVDRPGAPQTELRLGHVGLPRLHPDYFDVVVMNAILGGVFNSRINMNLREKNAFTYGAFSSFEWRRDAGPFCVSTAVATGVTGEAVREILAELEAMRAGPPTADELSLTQSYLDGVFPIRFETTDAIASALATLHTLRLPDDYYDTYRARVRAVTADSVLAAAQHHLHIEGLQLLAVGDSAGIRAPLEGLGLGPVTVTTDTTRDG